MHEDCLSYTDSSLLSVLDTDVLAALDTDLVGIIYEVVEADKACDELIVDVAVGTVDGTQTPVCVVVGVGAETKWSVCNI